MKTVPLVRNLGLLLVRRVVPAILDRLVTLRLLVRLVLVVRAVAWCSSSLRLLLVLGQLLPREQLLHLEHQRRRVRLVRLVLMRQMKLLMQIRGMPTVLGIMLAMGRIRLVDPCRRTCLIRRTTRFMDTMLAMGRTQRTVRMEIPAITPRPILPIMLVTRLTQRTARTTRTITLRRIINIMLGTLTMRLAGLLPRTTMQPRHERTTITTRIRTIMFRTITTLGRTIITTRGLTTTTTPTHTIRRVKTFTTPTGQTITTRLRIITL